MLKESWDGLSGTQKRWVVIGGAIFLMVAVIWIFSGDTPERESRGSKETVRHVLTDRDTREVSIDGLAAEIRRSNQQTDDLRNDFGSLKREVELSQQRNESTAAVRGELDGLRSQIELLIEQNMDLARLAEEQTFAAAAPNQVGGGSDRRALEDGESPFEAYGYTSGSQSIEDRDPYEVDADEVFSRPRSQPRSNWDETDSGRETAGTGRDSSRTNGNEEFANEGEGQGTATSGSNGATIFRHVAEESEAERQARESGQEDDEAMYIPSGSILTGILLNGMDAPTNSGSRRDPHPSLLRLNHEAILPNRFTADIRECHMLIAGHGDLSSERAFLRGETISCVRNDGGVIETQLNGYAVGEDGKVGVRGRLVSKQGAMIARSMVAGFMSGAAKAFDVDAVPVIQTGSSTGGNTQYQSNFSPSMFQGAAASGASSALDRIAQFYVDMAENIFPVIEVDAGREVELILTKGATLKIRN